ncbi:NAD-dependent malic enzyme [Candidatus Campbellbacteria bacterium]|nr:MAG: NAD-dependent malic enzyme [Candidatus Campbellbacteria bacterium]
MQKNNLKKESLKLHKKENGKIFTGLSVKLNTKKDLALSYTPGVAFVCDEIKKDSKKYKTLTSAGKTVAVISDGSAVLGLGNIGPKPAMSVMEGKSALFKKFADLNSVPIVLDTQNPDEVIQTIKNIAPSFAGINLEDIKAPQCFEVEEKLKKILNIPVFHDDQHGTAIVVLAGLINALKVVKKKKEKVKVVINGTGSAGIAIGKLLNQYGFKNIVFLDSKGIVSKKRNDLNKYKKEVLKFSKENSNGDLLVALENADIFVGVSKADLLKKEHIEVMNQKPIVFALANPNPEISKENAKKFGVEVLATGRSDCKNQVNNLLAFPGIFKGVIENDKKQITQEMKIKTAQTIASFIKKPSKDKFIPSVFEKKLVKKIVKEIKKCK